MAKVEVPDGYELIFRASRRDPHTGQVLWARKFGLKAWPILVPIGSDPADDHEI